MPDDKIVFEGERFVISDISADLPRHPRYPYGSSVVKPNGKRAVTGRYRSVPGRTIDTIYFHQTAGAYAPGRNGVMKTGRFFVTDPAYSPDGRWKGNGRGWPGFAYTWYVCHEPETIAGKYVIYQCNHLDTVSWHTAGRNKTGAGIAFQGYFRTRHIRNFRPFDGTDGEPSEAQLILAEAFWEEYAKGELGLTNRDISGHFEVSKKTCPGDTLEKFVLFKQQDEDNPERPEPLPAEQDRLSLDTWKLRQAALVVLGHDLGKYGSQHNGVDGKPGPMTRMAIETEEESMGLRPDGVWDERFENLLKVRLGAEGVGQGDLAGMA